jgi:hypothetical protein
MAMQAPCKPFANPVKNSSNQLQTQSISQKNRELDP